MLDPAGTCRCDTLMLGCTELSVLNEAFPLPQLPIIDAQAVLVEDTVSRAKAMGGLHLMMAQNPIYLITGE